MLKKSSQVHRQRSRSTSPWIQMSTMNLKNEPGTSSNSQPTVPVLPLHQGPAASSQGPAASAISGDEDSEYSDEYSAKSQDFGRTELCPDLCVLTNDEQWTMTPETQVCRRSGTFCFVTTENGDQQDMQFDHYAVCATFIVP